MKRKVKDLITASSASKDFLDAYHKACESSQPADWMDAALLAKQWECKISEALKEFEPTPSKYFFERRFVSFENGFMKLDVAGWLSTDAGKAQMQAVSRTGDRYTK